ncbi:hypothetical protein NM688_g2079 [Phlebia brevispora]|uniref:Uncharacterized protein n=1 Tax=Phlebia brevispora TaxID=194682 RepID=A0ACC1T9X5_9APHY|nr:hypothetical protein NM688_g2079 [Phlebia brevispora]
MSFKQLLVSVTTTLVIGVANAALTRRVACPDGVNTATNAACCGLFAVRDDLNENLFNGGQCNDEAHEALRLTFHDAIAISPALEAQGQFGGGGADGSIVIFADTETGFPANIGLDEVIDIQKPFIQRSNMSVAGSIQFAGAVAGSNCPGAPALPVFVGRQDATQPAPDGLVPEPFDLIDDVLARFADAGGFDELETVWFLIAHTVAAQNDIDPTIPRTPFDSTPELFDGTVMSPLKGEFRLQTDHLLARDSRTACEWQSFGTDQAKLQNRFQFIFGAMGQLGHDPDDLIDCSEVLPNPPPLTTTPHFPAGKTNKDVEQACAETPFPTLRTDPGPQTVVAPVPSSPRLMSWLFLRATMQQNLGGDVPPELFPRVLRFFVVNPTPAQLQEQNIRNIVHIDKHAIGAVGQVCRYWSTFCQEKLFERITLRSLDDVTQLAAFTRNPRSKVGTYIQAVTCSINLDKNIPPWLHLLSPLYDNLPLLSSSSSQRITVDVSGPLLSRYRTIRSIHYSIPRAIREYSLRFYVVKIHNVHFGSFHDLLHLVHELHNLSILTCTHVTWTTMPSILRWKSSCGKSPRTRQYKVVMDNCTHNWTALWLCVAFVQDIPLPFGGDLFQLGQLLGGMGTDFDSTTSTVRAQTQPFPNGAICIRFTVDATADAATRDIMFVFAIEPLAQHVTRIVAALPLSQFEGTNWKAAKDAISQLRHLQHITLRFYSQDHIDNFARNLRSKIDALVWNKLRFELWVPKSGLVMWKAASPQANQTIA